jgi:hypothetical protein
MQIASPNVGACRFPSFSSQFKAFQAGMDVARTLHKHLTPVAAWRGRRDDTSRGDWPLQEEQHEQHDS